MHGETELVAAILDDTDNTQAAEDILYAAHALGICPLEVLTHRLELAESTVYRRAAENLHLPYSDTIPSGLPGNLRIDHIDRLGGTRSVRLRLFDRDVTFISPTLEQFLTLGASAGAASTLRHTACIVPPSVLRAELAKRHKTALMDQARQRLARLWPFASAHLELTVAARLIFVVSLFALIAAAALAPFWLEPVLVPLLGVLFLLPAWFRLSALVDHWGQPDKPTAPALSDKELPVYTVLIPLYDEAQMVPQLAQAMRALDYPPLCIKRTNKGIAYSA